MQKSQLSQTRGAMQQEDRSMVSKHQRYANKIIYNASSP